MFDGQPDGNYDLQMDMCKDGQTPVSHTVLHDACTHRHILVMLLLYMMPDILAEDVFVEVIQSK